MIRSTKNYFLALCSLGLSLASTLVAKESAKPKTSFSGELKASSIIEVSNAVADWQLANPSRHADWDWTDGALWTGMMSHCHTTADAKYINAMKKVSEDLKFGLGPHRGFADDHCVGQLHLWHYLRDELPQQKEKTQQIMRAFIDRPHTESLKWVNHVHLREWAWCDSLYMAPPTLAMLHAATGDQKYLDVMDQLWWKTTAYLLDPKDDLYWRDSKYFGTKEANGENVYWSRGNGWVFAGTCHVLQHMPKDYPTRDKYIAVFKKMAKRLKALQLEDGSWHASLLDPDSFQSPESSGTAFFSYGFLWGINNGILDESEYLPAATKAWKRLVKNVHADGKLGYIQPIGEDPRKVTFDQTEVYGVGGFLQCAHELHKYLILNDSKTASITATNPTDGILLNEVVNISWDKVLAKLPSATAKNIGVRDGVRGYFASTQVVDANNDGTPEALLFRADFTPKEQRDFQLCAFGKLQPNLPETQLTARHVPERKDDFAWESERMAFRAYGPALTKEGARGGFDVWTKSVRTPVVNAWYEKGDAYYHTDSGTGLDGYKVGATLGCGGLGYLTPDGKLVTSPVYKEQKVLENGPLRLKFELKYAPIKVGKANIAETRTITMNAGEHDFTVHSSFQVEGDATGIIPVAGLATRDAAHKAFANTKDYVCYQDPVMKEKHGNIATFLVNTSDNDAKKESKHGHLLMHVGSDLSSPVSYSAGAIWQNVEARSDIWLNIFLKRAAQAARNPITAQ